MKKGKYKVGDLIRYWQLKGDGGYWNYCYVTKIEDTKHGQGLYGGYCSTIDEAKKAYKNGNTYGLMYENQVEHCIGFQTPLWRVLNGEEIE